MTVINYAPAVAGAPIQIPSSVLSGAGIIQLGGALTSLAVMLTANHDQILIATLGQSLALGTQGNPALTTSAAIFASNTRLAGTWPWDPVVEGTGTGGSGFDLEYGEVARVHQMRSLGPTDRHFAPLTAGASGDRLDELDIGSVPFNSLISQITTAFNTAATNGAPCEVGALCFIGGEADHRDGTARNTMRDNLLALQSDFTAAVQAVTGQVRPVPLFMTMADSWTQGSGQSAQSVIPLAMLDAADARSEEIFVTGTKNLFDHRPDSVHLPNTGYRLMGEVDGVALDAVLDRGVRWQSLRIRSATVSGSTITLQFHIPSVINGTSPAPAAALSFDTSVIAEPWTSRQGANSKYGFELRDFGPQPVHLTDAVIVGNTVQLTTDRPGRTGMVVAMNRTGIINSAVDTDEEHCAHSNLRDDSPETGIVSTTALRHYGVTCEQAVGGGVAAPASVATLLTDLDCTALYLADGAPDGPSTADWTAEVGVDAAHVSGSGHSTGNATGAAVSARIGASNLNNAWDPSSSYFLVPRAATFDKAVGEDFWIRIVGFLDQSQDAVLCRFQGSDGPNNQIYIESRTSGALFTRIFTQGGIDINNSAAGIVPVSATLSVVDVYYKARSRFDNTDSEVIICCNGSSGGTTSSGLFGVMDDLELYIWSQFGGTDIPPNAFVGMAVMIGEQARNQAAGPWGFIAEKNAADFAALTV